MEIKQTIKSFFKSYRHLLPFPSWRKRQSYPHMNLRIDWNQADSALYSDGISCFVCHNTPWDSLKKAKLWLVYNLKFCNIRYFLPKQSIVAKIAQLIKQGKYNERFLFILVSYFLLFNQSKFQSTDNHKPCSLILYKPYFKTESHGFVFCLP